MALDFPTSPSPNQVYTAGAKSWSWDNTSGAWLAVNAGIQGTQGTQGALGTQGAQGLQGITGANGSNGSQGIQGIQGTEGTAGFVGSNGAQGTQGIQGIQGTQGTQGIQGLKGTKITPGDTAPASPSENDLWWDSTNGILMVYYNDGTSAQWVTANSGIAGEQGIQGTQGIQGIQGTQGTQGIQGLQGVQGTQGTQGVQGIQGITGLAFTIAKTYLSVAALTADTSPTAIVAGQFALINTTNVEDAENSRLYIWTGSAYTFVDDLSGSAGIQGITGSQGVQGIQGIQGIQGTQGTQGIQGTQGTQGLQGIQGISGASILGTANTFTNTNAFTSLTSTNAITVSGTSATGDSRIALNASDYSSVPSYTSSILYQNGNSATGTTCGLANAGLGSLYFQNISNALIWTNSGTNMVFGIASAERMRINSSGNVGIGTASPVAKLEVNAGTGTAAFNNGIAIVTNSGTYTTGHGGILQFQNEDVITADIRVIRESGWGSGLAIYTHNTSSGNTFGTTVVERMRITEAGNVGIGTTSPNFTGIGIDHTVLSVGNSAAGMGMIELAGYRTSDADLGRVVFGNQGTRLAEIFASRIDANTSTKLSFSTADAGSMGVRMTISKTGNVGIGTTSPTEKLQVNGVLRIQGSTNDSGILALGNAQNGVGYYDNGVFRGGIGTLTNGNLTNISSYEGIVFNVSAAAFGSQTTRMIIKDTGNVGIGTTSPAQLLDILGTGAPSADINALALELQRTGASSSGTEKVGILFRQNNNSGASTMFDATRIYSQVEDASPNGSFKLGFATKTNGGALTDRMIVSSTGLAVTGTLSATGAITSVAGNANAGSFRANFNGGTGYALDTCDENNASGATFIQFRNAAGTSIGTIARVGTTNAVAYNTSSDARLKENLRNFTDSGRLIDALKPRVFDWKDSDSNGKNVIGFVAQEEHAADPIFTHIGAVSVGDDDPTTITKQWQRSDAALIPILVAELQSLRKRLAALEAK